MLDGLNRNVIEEQFTEKIEHVIDLERRVEFALVLSYTGALILAWWRGVSWEVVELSGAVFVLYAIIYVATRHVV